MAFKKKKKKSTTCNCVCLSLIREEDFDSNIYSVGFSDLCQTVTAQGHAIRDQQKKWTTFCATVEKFNNYFQLLTLPGQILNMSAPLGSSLLNLTSTTRIQQSVKVSFYSAHCTSQHKSADGSWSLLLWVKHLYGPPLFGSTEVKLLTHMNIL